MCAHTLCKVKFILVILFFYLLLLFTTHIGKYIGLTTTTRFKENTKNRKVVFHCPLPTADIYALHKLSNTNNCVNNQGSYAENISKYYFMQDNTPSKYNLISPIEGIHICLLAAKPNVSLELLMLVKSIVVHARRANVTFHIVATEGAESIISDVFNAVPVPYVKVFYDIIYIDIAAYLHKQLKFKLEILHPWAGIYGVVKIFLYDILSHVHKCIFVDTDILFGTDPAYLWYELNMRLNLSTIIAISLPDNDSYFNSGLMLQDYSRMRRIKFGKLIDMTNCQNDSRNSLAYTCIGGQILLNEILKGRPELFDTSLPVSWNLGLREKFRKFSFSSFEDPVTGIFFGAAHFTCLPIEDANDAFRAFKRYTNNQHPLVKYIDALDEIHG